MPPPFGRDRLATRSDGAFVLTSPYPKRWRARVKKTLTSAEFPGTAILWDEIHYEVIEAEESSNGHSTYVLAPWKEQHQIRIRELYDVASEERRKRLHARDQARQRNASRYAWLGVIFGHLPAKAQKEIELEYGVPPTMQTMVSTVPFLLLGVAAAASFPIQGLPNASTLPKWLFVVAPFFFLESVIRLRYALSGRPIGSVIGTVAFYLFLRKGFARKVAASEAEDLERHGQSTARTPGRVVASNPMLLHQPEKGAHAARAPRDWNLSTGEESETPAELILRDAYTLREPFASLLAAEDQLRLNQRFGFDFVRWGNLSAGALLIGSFLGALAAFAGDFSITKFLSLAMALFLTGEQIVRLQLLQKEKPAPSILRFLVRRWMRPLFDLPDAPPPVEERALALPEMWEGEEKSPE